MRTTCFHTYGFGTYAEDVSRAARALATLVLRWCKAGSSGCVSDHIDASVITWITDAESPPLLPSSPTRGVAMLAHPNDFDVTSGSLPRAAG
eukprot:3141530-Pyramimonas_sp.AAC.1